MNQKTAKPETFVRLLICLFGIFLMGVLTIASVFSTTGMEIIDWGAGTDTVVERIRDGNEVVWYYHDNIFANLIWLVITLIACFAVMPYLKKISFRKEILIVSIWVILFGSIWVISSQVKPTYDSLNVAEASLRASNNDFGWMSEDNYFSYYSYQLGYVLFNEIFFRIQHLFTETETYLFLEILNVIFLAGIYAGILVLCKLLFSDERIHHLTAVLLLFSVQPILASVFIYAIYPGMLFAVWAIVFEILYFQTNKIHYLPISAVLISVGYLVKPNYLIFLIAMLIVIAVKTIAYRKQIKTLILNLTYIFMTCCMSFSLLNYVTISYEARSQISFGEAIPMSSFVAMGLNLAENAPGWYNPYYTITNFENHNYSKKEASEASVQEIKAQIKHFSEDPNYKNEFFYKKFMSQWNETSYQSIWNNKVREQYEEKTRFATWVCYDGEHAVKYYMDIYSQLIFTGVLLGCIACFRKKELVQLFPLLIVIGGMLYHLMAESKSQYAMPYYLLMIGFAPVGICWLYDMLKPELLKLKEKRGFLERTKSEQNQQVSELTAPAQSGNSRD